MRDYGLGGKRSPMGVMPKISIFDITENMLPPPRPAYQPRTEVERLLIELLKQPDQPRRERTGLGRRDSYGIKEREHSSTRCCCCRCGISLSRRQRSSSRTDAWVDCVDMDRDVLMDEGISTARSEALRAGGVS